MRVACFGLDGATWKVLTPMIEGGEMPFLEELISRGATSILESNPFLNSASAWSTISTGKKTVKHNIGDFVEVGEDYRLKATNLSKMKRHFFWDILSEQGKRVGILNVPATYPPHHVNGFMISGWLSPNPKEASYPPKIMEKLKKDTDYTLFEQNEMVRKGEEFISYIEKNLENKIEATKLLLRKYDLDFFFIVFDATDRMYHRFWRTIEDPARNQKLFEKIKAIHNKIDTGLEEICDLADPQNKLIFSDHGFCPVKKQVNLNTFLFKEGFLKINDDLTSSLKFALSYRFSPRKVLDLLPPSLLELGKNTDMELQTRLRDLFFLSPANIDWEHTKAFSFGTFNYIYLNLKGRESNGCVKRQDYEAVKKKLIEKLRHWEENGERIVTNIHEVNQKNGSLPDLILEIRDGKYVTTWKNGFTISKLYSKPDLYFGHHHKEGIFIGEGKNFNTKDGFGGTIHDIAPTVLKLFGLPIPDYMDGKPLEGAISSLPSSSPTHSVSKESLLKSKFKERARKLWEDL